MNLEFQVFSDLHLSDGGWSHRVDDLVDLVKIFEKYFPQKTQILFLAGDIGQINCPIYKRFFDYVSSRWKYVFYVLGNNEYYVSKTLKISKEETLKMYKDYLKINYTNIHLLEKGIIYLPIADREDNKTTTTLRILGCTLWSYATENTKNLSNSFDKILNSNLLPISPEEYNEMNGQSIDWLLKELSSPNFGGSYVTIVLTHYPTLSKGTSDPSYERTQTIEQKRFYSNDLYNLISSLSYYSSRKTCINDAIFISGHTHYSFDLFKKEFRAGRIMSSIRYISNQFGHRFGYYDDEKKEEVKNPDGKLVTGFEKEKVFSLLL